MKRATLGDDVIFRSLPSGRLCRTNKFLWRESLTIKELRLFDHDSSLPNFHLQALRFHRHCRSVMETSNTCKSLQRNYMWYELSSLRVFPAS